MLVIRKSLIAVSLDVMQVNLMRMDVSEEVFVLQLSPPIKRFMRHRMNYNATDLQF